MSEASSATPLPTLWDTEAGRAVAHWEMRGEPEAIEEPPLPPSTPFNMELLARARDRGLITPKEYVMLLRNEGERRANELKQPVMQRRRSPARIVRERDDSRQLSRWLDLGFSLVEARNIVADERRRAIQRALASGATAAAVGRAQGISGGRIIQIARCERPAGGRSPIVALTGGGFPELTLYMHDAELRKASLRKARLRKEAAELRRGAAEMLACAEALERMA